MSIKVWGENFYAGRDHRTGEKVAAHEGIAALVDGQKVIFSKKNAPTAEEIRLGRLLRPGEKPPPPRALAENETPPDEFLLVLAPGPDVEVVLPAERLGPTKFADFRTASSLYTRSAKDAQGKWHTYLRASNVPSFMAAMEKAGFKVVVSAAAKAKIEANADEMRIVKEALLLRLQTRGEKLYGYQKEGVKFLGLRHAAAILDEQGLGKTIQLLMAVPEGAPVVIVVPASVKLNWKREIGIWRPEFKVKVLEGRDSFAWPQPGTIHVTNFDILDAAPAKPETDGIWPQPRPDEIPPRGVVLIADEAHKLKNAKAKRTGAFRWLSHLVREHANGYVWIATGTVMPNEPAELWTVLNAAGLSKGAFTSFENYMAIWGAHKGNYGIEWPDKPKDPAALAAGLERVALRRTKDKTLDLPPKTRIQITLDVKIPAALEEELDEALQLVESRGMKKDGKVQGDFSVRFEEFSKLRAATAKTKAPAAAEWMVDTLLTDGQPLVVYSSMVEPLKLLEKALRAKLKDDMPEVRYIIGETSMVDRQRNVEDFQAGKFPLIFLTSAAREGITLTRASRMVYLDTELVPGYNAQSEDRIHRIGQSKPATYYYLKLAHAFEDWITDLLLYKQTRIEKSVELVSKGRDDKAIEVDELPTLTVREEAPKPEAPTKGPPARIQTVTDRRGKKHVVPLLAHPAKTPAERWIEAAVMRLSDLDPDRAFWKNEMGWSAGDGATGHRFAAMLEGGYGLTDPQWTEAAAMLKKYHRQVGTRPAGVIILAVRKFDGE